MKVWLMIKTDGSNYRLFKDKPTIAQIKHHFYYGSKSSEDLAQKVLNGDLVMGWYLTEEEVE